MTTKSDAKKGKKAEGGEDELEPGQKPEGGEEGEGEEEEEGEKSLDLTADDLERSLSQLEAQAAAQPESRKNVLLAKAQKGELSKAEVDELHIVLGGGAPGAAPVAEDLTRGLVENEELRKSVDVSGILAEFQNELVKALGSVGEHMSASDARQHEFNLLLARAQVETGRQVLALVKSVQDALGQPAHAPKSKGIPGAQPLEKGFAGAEGSEQISKGQVLEALGELVEKSMNEGHGGVTSNGEDLAIAASRYEQFGTMSKSIAGEVLEHIRAKRRG